MLGPKRSSATPFCHHLSTYTYTILTTNTQQKHVTAQSISVYAANVCTTIKLTSLISTKATTWPVLTIAIKNKLKCVTKDHGMLYIVWILFSLVKWFYGELFWLQQIIFVKEWYNPSCVICAVNRLTELTASN